MSLGDHININLKQGVKIITCEPATGTIEAETRNGEVIPINAYHQTPTFRWPVPGERWMVTEENGSWFLAGIYEQQIPYEPKAGEPVAVQPGDTVISAGSGTIWKNTEGKLTPLVEAVTTLSVSDYIEVLGSQNKPLGEFVVPVNKSTRFLLALFTMRYNFESELQPHAAIIVNGKELALAERSGSAGEFYKTTLTVVAPALATVKIIGTNPADITLTKVWESVS